MQADLENLPFEDDEFDFAYSHHVVEHLEDPSKALDEMMRVARKGCIICQSFFAENMFGRIYHKWYISWNNNTIFFVEKDSGVVPPFGLGPTVENGKTRQPKNCNPFDILLNDGDWYHGIHRYRKLTKMMRNYWYGHYKVMETVFNWEESFNYVVLYSDGSIKTNIVCQ